MATATYCMIDNAIALAREIAANENQPVSLTAPEIDQTPNLPATVKVDGIDVHYFAAPTQVVTPGIPILLFLSRDSSAAAANDDPVNDHDALPVRLAPRLPERMRAKIAPRPNRAKLKVAHTHTPPKPTISVATPFVQPKIKWIDEKKARENYLALKLGPKSPECMVAPEPTPTARRLNLEDLDKLNEMNRARAERTFKRMVLLAAEIALAPAPAA